MCPQPKPPQIIQAAPEPTPEKSAKAIQREEEEARFNDGDIRGYHMSSSVLKPRNQGALRDKLGG